ncbi:hypothetical protein CBM2637_A70091 [Cupriavidus taiwanensis]|nr:hypothetical protein CBM2637_A70091 [Cupriavidus taiwanensis]
MVRRHHRAGPAPADLAHAGAGNAPPDAALDQYRHDRGGAPGRLGAATPADLHRRHADGRGAGHAGADTLYPLGQRAGAGADRAGAGHGGLARAQGAHDRLKAQGCAGRGGSPPVPQARQRRAGRFSSAARSPRTRWPRRS